MIMESTTNLDFKKTRAMNWLVAIILLIGFSLLALKASSAIGLLFFGLVMLVFIVPFVISAIVLSDDDFYLFGASLTLSATKRDFLRKVAWYGNWVIFVFSVLGIVMSLVTQQSMVIISFLIYAFPSLINLIAFKKLRNSLLK
jgi:hypothetical protein